MQQRWTASAIISNKLHWLQKNDLFQKVHIFILACTSAADVIFAVDASGSIGKDNFRNLIQFAVQAANNFDLDHPDTGLSLNWNIIVFHCVVI